MSLYRYVVFPPGASPTVEELKLLRAHADQLNHHIALGTQRGDGGLAVACESAPFDRLRGLDPAFEGLLTHWRARGGRVVEKLAFVKDAKAWKNLPSAREPKPAAPHATTQSAAAQYAVRVDPREAVGRVRLSTRNLADNVESIERFAGLIPYALWGIGAAMVLGVGVYVGVRLAGSGVERRSETIERAIENPSDKPVMRTDGRSP